MSNNEGTNPIVVVNVLPAIGIEIESTTSKIRAGNPAFLEVASECLPYTTATGCYSVGRLVNIIYPNPSP